MAKTNYHKEIAEYQKRIAELEREAAKESLAPAMAVISEEVLRNLDAVTALAQLSKDEIRAVAKVIADGVTEAIEQASPEIEKIRVRKAKQSAARKAKREASERETVSGEQEDEGNMMSVSEDESVDVPASDFGRETANNPYPRSDLYR